MMESDLKAADTPEAAHPASDWDNRRLCSDGSCIGVIGPDGRCKECGKLHSIDAGDVPPPAVFAAPPLRPAPASKRRSWPLKPMTTGKAAVCAATEAASG